MKLPSKVKVGTCNYKIVQRKMDDEDYIGRVYPNKCEIEIEKRLSDEKKITTLFHELIHAISFEYGNFKLGESKTDLMAVGVISILRDNPALVRLI